MGRLVGEHSQWPAVAMVAVGKPAWELHGHLAWRQVMLPYPRPQDGCQPSLAVPRPLRILAAVVAVVAVAAALKVAVVELVRLQDFAMDCQRAPVTPSTARAQLLGWPEFVLASSSRVRRYQVRQVQPQIYTDTVTALNTACIHHPGLNRQQNRTWDLFRQSFEVP